MTTQTRFRILIADDDPAIRELLTQILSDDYDVAEAVNGEQALEGIQSGKYDLILLDFQLPGMTGIDVLKQLRDRQGELPVILVTGHGSPNVAIQASSLGVYGFVSKPFDIDYLLQLVTHFFEAQRLKDEVRVLRTQVEPIPGGASGGSLQGRVRKRRL